ncbi:MULTISPECIES: DUF2335 domain-containing protein [Shewanella]|uniref:DUF2335 domain-containing protein n=1 Tax=Shewanella psychromarinicola TaxID=2487742 RepID=A0A3N4DQX5_9GAMM|nr:DUF2335 domain-containing protein [Shewanella psychromarinicola]AZG35635.1 DUF2335 domain-containing protein [Shewanella psychromarinicola]MCL1081335.1 DUF2335 domain-containing protein [Shewanella psychromarinicola]RPA27616.1 DUF2335 domain-containing protein [Shewanella psychromarinicola]
MSENGAGNTEKNNVQENDEPESIEGVLERVSVNDPEAGRVLSQYIEVHTSHRGPMPSPDDLQKYSVILPELPDRMMSMAENSQTEKIKQHSKILELKSKEIEVQKLEVEQSDAAHKREIFTQQLSLILAFIVVLICIVGAFYLALNDKTAVALVIGGTTVVGIVVAFLKNKNSTKSPD